DAEGPAKELRESHVRLGLHGLALELIDLLINALQSRRVSRPEISAARFVRDVGEKRLVDAHWPVLVAEAEQSAPDRYRSHAFGANANRVDLDSERGRCPPGGARINRAAVVLAVGEKDDDFGTSRRRAQSVRRRGERRPNGCSILELTWSEIVDCRGDDRIVRR